MSGLIQSLHSHTTTSDGKLTHTELLKAAHKYEIGTVAFTDHDALPDESTLRALASYKGYPTKWIIGIEISSGLPIEVGYGPYAGLHIVGLFVDPTNRPLLEHCRKAQNARVSRMEKIVANLTGLGFHITIADCLKASGGEAVGRPHIVQALKSKTENLTIIDKYIQKMAADTSNNSQVKQKYDWMIERKDAQAVYTLFLSDDSYVPNVYVDYLYWTDMDKTVGLIRQAGGLAIVAHYSTAKTKVPLDMLEKFITAKRLDGLETVYGVYGLEGSEQTDWDSDRVLLRQLVARYHCLKSGGADVHSVEDLSFFAGRQDYSRETIGMAETIISQSKVDTTWSSF